MICERLAPASRAFALAYQLALLEQRDLLAAIVERAAPPTEPSRAPAAGLSGQLSGRRRS